MKKLLFVFLVLCQSLILYAQTSGTPCEGIHTVTYAGQTYHTVQIGTQCWLRENLNVGTMIDSTIKQTNNGVIEKYCYDNSPDSCSKYGGFYQWAEAVQYKNGATDTTSASPSLTGNVQGICPTGWHIPSEVEYHTLSSVVNNNGNALKAVGQGTGTNTSGFSALLAGARPVSSGFHGLGYYTNIWSSSVESTTIANFMYLYLGNTVLHEAYYSGNKENGFSVRCLKDN